MTEIKKNWQKEKKRGRNLKFAWQKAKNNLAEIKKKRGRNQKKRGKNKNLRGRNQKNA